LPGILTVPGILTAAPPMLPDPTTGAQRRSTLPYAVDPEIDVRYSHPIVVAALFLLAASPSLPAFAQVIFSTFGAGDTHTNNGWDIRGANIRPGRQDVAGSFATDYGPSWDRLVFEAAVQDLADQDPAPFAINFHLNFDDGDIPGEAIITSPAMVTSKTEGGTILTWTLAPSVTLSPNTTYWFSATSPSPDGHLGWDLGVPINRAGTVTKLGLGGRPGAWVNVPNTALAFRVSGQQLTGAPPAVPEPGVWATFSVLSLCLVGLIVRKRRPMSGRPSSWFRPMSG